MSFWAWTYVFDWKWHRVLSFTLWNVVLCSSVVIGDVTGSSMHPSFYWRRISPLMPCLLNLSSISKPSFSFCCNSSNLKRLSLSKGLITPRLRTTFLITSFRSINGRSDFHNSPTLFTQRWQIFNAERLGRRASSCWTESVPNALIPRVIKLHTVVIIQTRRLRLLMSFGEKGSVVGTGYPGSGSGFHWCQIQGAGKPGGYLKSWQARASAW